MSIRETTTAIVANRLGAKEFSLVNISLKAALKVLIIVFALISIPMLLFSDITIAFLTGGNSELRDDTFFYSILLNSLWIMVVSTFASCVNAAVFGVFAAGGNLRYVALVNTFSTWCFAVIPIVFMISKFNIPLKYSIWLYQPYRLFVIGALYVGYKKGKWLFNIER